MMYLRTIPERISENVVCVHWSVGRKRGGKLLVELDPTFGEIDLIAELCALRFLLLDRRVFNVIPTSGKGYCLQVSTGAIRKLALQKSTKYEAVPFAAFLSSRMNGAQIEVVSRKDLPTFDSDANIEEDRICPDLDVYANSHEPIETPALGTVYVTAHAVKRYVERNVSGDAKSPWRTLVKRLQHSELRQLPIPEKHVRHKKRKYGEANEVETWGHPSSSLVYVVVNDGQHRVVVTVFRRGPQS